ncbi:alpha-keto acid decarboxylase family protein [Psychrobacter cryohalolentis]|uniref:Pyruvate decarboxylase n=1 Tax=Psychrobacter cryohalolentis (strain ATCC BAA-1226 / DSM 17306 / VKM B-2378 / K5) TaxID=335284 RepID=Q1QC58_PSYCK|nr:thiamine pyrophosphate-binding protein [Psychrobacter cryohalolentis]ABE74745.1 Pyruvate decarboxylase [Psychrobacter cryohalolentis K5]ASE27357.1 indolepyruvate decarboxylase [Psychrobacter cryohalolentis]
MSQQYTIADYLFDRVAEAGASEVFGVPGDFNLTFLDNVLASDKLRWVGNTNELNAGYAADGYARERGFAAMVTTFGVGELSAINATAGSFAEYAPVLHIVGAPSTALQDSKRRIHHSLGDGVFNHFIKMVEPVTVARAQITPENAASEIDRVIRVILKKHRPGYLLLSPDVAKTPIYPPTTKLIDSEEDITSQAALADFKQALIEFLPNKTTTLMADLMVHRLGLQNQLKALIADTDIPYTTLSWGKTLLDENSERWAGTYAGVASRPVVKDMVENCECLIKIGVQYTDTTTAGFSQDIDENVVVDLHYERASIAGKNFAPIALKDALKTLHEVMTSDINIVPKQFCEEVKQHEQHGKDNEAIRQDDLWHIIADALDDKNLVFSEQGTAYFGISDVRLPEGVTSYGQPMWGSIGYTLPASLGGAIASPHKRSILLIGDGSALLTIQEIAVMIQERINPVIVLINNDGYTVERAIHGENQYYNDIPKCDWQLMPKAFGANANNSLLLKAETAGELKDALKQAAAAKDKLVMLEVIAGKHDIPPLLADISAALKPKND